MCHFPDFCAIDSLDAATEQAKRGLTEMGHFRKSTAREKPNRAYENIKN